MNEFERAIENCSYSTDWNELRLEIVETILSFKEQMKGLKEYRTQGEEDFIYLIVFSLFNKVYIYTQTFDKGLIETAQLEKIIDYDNEKSTVLYANVENAPNCFPYAKRLLKSGLFTRIDTISGLNRSKEEYDDEYYDDDNDEYYDDDNDEYSDYDGSDIDGSDYRYCNNNNEHINESNNHIQDIQESEQYLEEAKEKYAADLERVRNGKLHSWEDADQVLQRDKDDIKFWEENIKFWEYWEGDEFTSI